MPCLIAILMLAFPRIALALVFFFTPRVETTFHDGLLIPLLGFLFLPLTTLVYVLMISSGLAVAGVNLLFLGIAVVVDLGLVGGSWRSRR